MKYILCFISLIIVAPLVGISPIQEDFRFVDQSYTSTQTTPAGHKLEETKHFHKNAAIGMIIERTITVSDGEVTGLERAWWFTDENQNNHFRVALMANGNLVTSAIGRVSSGYKGVGFNENERGWHFATQYNYNAANYGRLRISSGPLVARGHVNESMFFRKTWSRSDLDLDGFNKLFRSSESRNFELADELKFVEPLLGVWEGTDNNGRPHRNMFAKLSPRWVLEFWRVGGEDEDGPRGTNIIGTDTLRGGAVTRSAMGRQGFNRFAGRYESAEPGTVLQFQGNNYLVRKVSGDTMTVTWQSLEGTEYVESRSYKLKKAN